MNSKCNNVFKYLVLNTTTRNIIYRFIQRFNKVAVVGPMADDMQQLFGDYSPNVNKNFTQTPRQALSAIANTVRYM